MSRPEIGLSQISQTAARRADRIFAQLPAGMTSLQWYGVEVTTLPHDAGLHRGEGLGSEASGGDM